MGRAFEYRKARKMKRWGAMSKAFSRIGKEILIAVKSGGPSPDSNSRLRALLQNAKAVNMPKENVERAIKKALNKDENEIKEIVYEGYGPHGIAIVIETATDNPNRTVANLRTYLSRSNGSLAIGSYVFFAKAKCPSALSLAESIMSKSSPKYCSSKTVRQMALGRCVACPWMRVCAAKRAVPSSAKRQKNGRICTFMPWLKMWLEVPLDKPKAKNRDFCARFRYFK